MSCSLKYLLLTTFYILHSYFSLINSLLWYLNCCIYLSLFELCFLNLWNLSILSLLADLLFKRELQLRCYLDLCRLLLILLICVMLCLSRLKVCSLGRIVIFSVYFSLTLLQDVLKILNRLVLSFEYNSYRVKEWDWCKLCLNENTLKSPKILSIS